MDDHSYSMTLVRQRPLQLVFFPGEKVEGDSAFGHLYVYEKGKLVKAFEARGGPPPGSGYAGPGGHTAGVTPNGSYVLSAAEHHTTLNWPYSSVPWGAKLRARSDGDIEFSSDGGAWKPATGANGCTSQAYFLWSERNEASAAKLEHRAPKPLSADQRKQLILQSRQVFYRGGKLITDYDQNDFGKWAFNLTVNGARSPYYVHTTPADEHATAAGQAVNLENSHGCVHVKPAERDELMQKGWLKKGVNFYVAHYGVAGP